VLRDMQAILAGDPQYSTRVVLAGPEFFCLLFCEENN